MHCFNCLNFSWSVRTFCNLILYLKSTLIFCIFFGGSATAVTTRFSCRHERCRGSPKALGMFFEWCLGIEFGQVIEEKDVFKLMRGLPTKIIDSIRDSCRYKHFLRITFVRPASRWGRLKLPLQWESACAGGRTPCPSCIVWIEALWCQATWNNTEGLHVFSQTFGAKSLRCTVLKKVGIPCVEEMFRRPGTVSFNTAMNSLGGAGVPCDFCVFAVLRHCTFNV